MMILILLGTLVISVGGAVWSTSYYTKHEAPDSVVRLHLAVALFACAAIGGLGLSYALVFDSGVFDGFASAFIVCTLLFSASNFRIYRRVMSQRLRIRDQEDATS